MSEWRVDTCAIGSFLSDTHPIVPFYGTLSVMEATKRFTIGTVHSTFAVSNMILLGALLLSFILVLFFKGENKRFKAEPHRRRR